MGIWDSAARFLSGIQIPGGAVQGETAFSSDASGTLAWGGWPIYVGNGPPSGSPANGGAHAFYVDIQASPPNFYVWA
jgi:hypothetical protein